MLRPACLVLLLALVAPSTAQAEEDPPLETADGYDGCLALRTRNEEERIAFEKKQPPVPYRYPQEKLFLDAPWNKLFGNLGHSGDLLLSTILPHIGPQYRGDYPAVMVSWPWTLLVFGPMYACSRKPNTFVVHGHRAHRLMLEPAVVAGKQGVGVSVRPGCRFIWHPSSWVVGPGIGIGSTVEIAGNKEPFRASVSPEAVAHFGACCSSSYVTLAVRYDHYVKGVNRDIIGASLGYTFF